MIYCIVQPKLVRKRPGAIPINGITAMGSQTETFGTKLTAMVVVVLPGPGEQPSGISSTCQHLAGVILETVETIETVRTSEIHQIFL